ncbi:MAG: hypothetical protein Q9195_003197 [Heterodermia aff. obscurata]
MDEVNASAIQLNNTLSHNGQSNGTPQHPDSQTASEYIDEQLQQEADAREALPYVSIRSLYSTTRISAPEPVLMPDLPSTSSLDLRSLYPSRYPATGLKGPVHSQPASEGNTYNQNFQNRFCGCGEVYDAHTEKGTMFQCLGLATQADGGCGEDWWHPECVVGLGRDWARKDKIEQKQENGTTLADDEDEHDDDAEKAPPGFPREEDFETFICYKCVNAHPWVRRYAGSAGFLPAVYKRDAHHEAASEDAKYTSTEKLAETNGQGNLASLDEVPSSGATSASDLKATPNNAKKRKAGDTGDDLISSSIDSKKVKTESNNTCHYETLEEPASGQLSLFLRENFRDHMCRCPKCYPVISQHRQLLEEEESYEPPLSEDGQEGNRSAGTGSLLDRGEAALSNVERVRAIEGVMVYNHLKDKVKDFLQPFADSGQAVGADDIKAYFEKLRGDEQGMKSAQTLVGGGGDTEGDNRREQSGKA